MVVQEIDAGKDCNILLLEARIQKFLLVWPGSLFAGLDLSIDRSRLLPGHYGVRGAGTSILWL